MMKLIMSHVLDVVKYEEARIVRQITYKYNVGDTIKFKDKFYPYASCGLKERAGTTAVVTERLDYCGATYRLKGITGLFKESCFAGIKEDN